MTPHILVVDDNEDLSEDIREIFEEIGVRVTLVGDAGEAEVLAGKDPFDLALVDVRLPTGESGLSLLPRLRDASPDGEVIVMTGAATLHSAMEAVRHGVFGYLPKPFDPDDLIRMAQRALSQVSLRRERTALSRELARSEALHRAVFDTVESMIVGVDEGYLIRLWNRRAAEVTGWTAREAIGKDACELLLEEGHRGRLHEMLTAAHSGAMQEARMGVRTRDGSPRIVHWHVRPLVSGTTRDRMALLAGTDLTEKIELETRAAEAEAMAVMGRLTSALAHEIRNPLNAATLQLELIRRSAGRIGNEGIERRANIVADELTRLTSMLDDFLGLARPKSLAMTEFDPVAVAWNVHTLHEPSAKEAGLELSVNVTGDIPAIRGDAARLKQALINLVVNAIDAAAGEDGGHVELGISVVDGTVLLTVEDDGPGLPADERILEPFATTKEGGTGLGLPIVKRIAEMHGGELSIGAREGGGTRATIAIPAAGPT